MPDASNQDRAADLTLALREVRSHTEWLADPLGAEDQTVQSMEDVSPTKWHRAHTTWFFETFLLEPFLAGYQPFHPAFGYLFNSYYEALGSRFPRPARGVLSRPGVEEIGRYRAHADQALFRLLLGHLDDEQLDLVELGLHHEQQHQELLLMDAKHVLSCNPLSPTYRPLESPVRAGVASQPEKAAWTEHLGGKVEVGAGRDGFAYDNERPRHGVELVPFALCERPVSCGEWMEFIEDDGYSRPELWLSDGWALSQQEGWRAPLYWTDDVGRPWANGRQSPLENASGPWLFTLNGLRSIEPAEPVCHVSYYEADAFARWAGGRLPTEAEWEAVAVAEEAPRSPGAPTAEERPLHPRPVGARAPMLGDVWQWTSSSYGPYPGFRPAAGAVGEYNGKFMVNQYVLRGGCCLTPPGHIRSTYRNFFPAAARWVMSGLRMARDL